MKRIKLFEEFENNSLSELINKLKSCDIPCDLWGTGQSKTVRYLLKELEEKECYLEEKDGLITRYIEFVGIKVFFRKDDGEVLKLKEDRQEFNDGRSRKRNMPSSVSEKMKAGEDPLSSAVRGVKEELGIDIDESQLQKYSDLYYDGGSLSYPGLITKYKGHRYVCYLTPEQFEPNGYVEIQEDKKTFFTWS